MKRKQVELILNLNGFKFVRSNKHLIYSNGQKVVAIPHERDYSKGLSRRIFIQAGFTKDMIKEIM